MAKTKVLRVHNLASELGVQSKAILEKCRAEGIELKNHMATISAGLAESIREWFQPGADVTTVEVAAPVDLDKVQRPRRAKAAGESDESAEEGSGVAVAEQEAGPAEAAEQAVEEPPAEEAPAIAASSESNKTEPVAAEPVAAEEAAPTAAPAADEDDDQQAQADEPPAPTPAAPSRAPQIPPVKPVKPVRPAGPQIVPKPAALKGPQVVRIEKPESDPRPRTRVSRPAAQAGGPWPPTDSPRGPGGPPRRAGGTAANAAAEAEKAKRAGREKRRGNLSDINERLREWRDQDVIDRRERLASATGTGLRDRRAKERRRQQSSSSGPSTIARKNEVEVEAPISLRDFCAAVGVPFGQVNAKLMAHSGKLHTINEIIDSDQVEMLVIDLGLPIKVRAARTALEKVKDEHAARERSHLKPRPPVVAMLGHVDHGKTSLLDAIRATSVAAGEAGGITQHIGAYRIDKGDWHVTFLDTPGHEAFTAMRARGANLTDVVVLVVAADDGVMPQTIEAINHAKAAGVQIVVALNKIDLPSANIDKIYGELSAQELVPTEWGGSIDVVKTSATKGIGIDDLIEHLSTLSELLDLKADATVPAHGTVIEAQMREGRGVGAQVLVREGKLKVGQVVVCGPAFGKVRSLIDDKGKRLKEAGPATPVEIVGLDALPEAGDDLFVLKDLSVAKEIASDVKQKRRESQLQSQRGKPTSLEDFLASAGAEETPELSVIIKADTQGSVETLKAELDKVPRTKARLRVLHAAVGAVSEADVTLAQASSAVIFGFHVACDDRARQAADNAGVQVRLYRVIYEILGDVHKALEGLLTPEQKEEYRGRAEIRQIFNITRVGTIAGCYVTDGKIERSNKARLIRNGIVVTEGRGLASLKRFKDDAREVRSGFECGIRLEGFDDVKPGDIIESYQIVEVAQKL